MKELVIASVLLGLAAALSAAEAVPEYVTLTIRDGRVSGMNFESARTPLVRTSLRGDVLDVDIRAEFPPGKGGCKFDFAIPPEAKKMKLFGCVFDLPPAGYTAFFHSFLLAEIRKPWWRFSRDETQRAMLLISYAPDLRSFEAQLRYFGNSGKESWTQERNFSCIVADDGQIYEKLDDDARRRFGPGIRFWDSYTFRNIDGKLRFRPSVTGRYYKYLAKKEFVFTDVPLPPPEDRPCTLFFLNRPFKGKYLAESQAGDFALKRSVAEFRNFAEKLKSLRSGMTSQETAQLLGKPDRYQTVGAKGPNTRVHANAIYDFLRVGDTSLKNLGVTLWFEKDSAGVFRLKTVY